MAPNRFDGVEDEVALRRAAFALLFVTMEHFEAFEQFVRGKELTDEERAHLERLGLEH